MFMVSFPWVRCCPWLKLALLDVFEASTCGSGPEYSPSLDLFEAPTEGSGPEYRPSLDLFEASTGALGQSIAQVWICLRCQQGLWARESPKSGFVWGVNRGSGPESRPSLDLFEASTGALGQSIAQVWICLRRQQGLWAEISDSPATRLEPSQPLSSHLNTCSGCYSPFSSSFSPSAVASHQPVSSHLNTCSSCCSPFSSSFSPSAVASHLQ